MSEGPVEYTTQSGKKRNNVAQVTGCDVTAELLATWRALLPAITTVTAYTEAVKLYDALMHNVEAFEKSEAFKRITRNTRYCIGGLLVSSRSPRRLSG